MSRLAAPLILIALIVLMGWLMFSGETEEAPGPATTTNLDPDKGDIAIEGVDWAALGAWLRQYVAQDDPASSLDEFAGLQRALDDFIRDASSSRRANAIEGDAIQALKDDAEAWIDADPTRKERRAGTLATRLVDPASGPALQRALGPGILAGLHESLKRMQDTLRDGMRRTRDDLATATGDERVKLERSLRWSEDALAALASIPEPTAEGRAMWARIQAAGRREDP